MSNEKINFYELKDVEVNKQSDQISAVKFKFKDNQSKSDGTIDKSYSPSYFIGQDSNSNMFYLEDENGGILSTESNIERLLSSIFLAEDSVEKFLLDRKFFSKMESNIKRGFYFACIKLPFEDIDFNEKEEKKWFDYKTRLQNILTRLEIQLQDEDGIFFFVPYRRYEQENENSKLTPMPFMIHYDKYFKHDSKDDSKYDFKYDFELTTNEDIDFTGNIFTDEENEINNFIHILLGDEKINPNLHVYFDKAIFLKKVSFFNSTFFNKADFLATQFNEKADFGNTKFKQKADFRWATFKQELDLSLSNFEETFFFKHINPEREKKVKENNKDEKEINFSPVQLNLKSAMIEKMEWEDTNLEVEKVANRETFLVLKQIALKQNDNIQALEFHTKEMEKHYEELKENGFKKFFIEWFKKLKENGFKKFFIEWFKKLKENEFKKFFIEQFKNEVNIFLLCIEKKISYFGTNPAKAIGWFLLINILFLMVQIYYYKVCFEAKTIFEILLPFKAEEPNFIHLLAFVVNPFLLYEIVKSLRKYSRKL